MATPTPIPRTPCYVMDVDIAKRNAQRMLKRAEDAGCELRPHVKTHKTVEGALLQTGGRKSKIVVSTLKEAQHFAAGGFDDILYAVPITPDKLDEAAELCCRITFHVMVDNTQQLEALLDHPHCKWSVFIMVDCGYHRDGVDPSSQSALDLAKKITQSDATTLKGVYTHGGGSYDARGKEEILKYSVQERDAVVEFSQRLQKAGIAVGTVGVGSTPTCSHVPEDGLEGVNEMHPGNYLTYDSMQCDIGSCTVEDVAVRVLTRIVGIYPERNMLIVDMGWTGCSVQGAATGYGRITSHPELKVKVLKQEAGEVVPKSGTLDHEKYRIGMVLELAPHHSCAAAALHSSVLIKQNGELTGEKWVPCRGW
eukprot:TRINITY_DN13586_c0_g1_i1.p1 TRINITY_DN13586_c0_g1~~TRINITY_DN13586_c0_g1_i1.p1  ORF type:complete len:366 (+),score=103.34 TRINITY_DN13586_c0_g1_i1:510-1607(+)